MTRNLVGALLLAGSLLAIVGCDTSPGSGSAGPSVTATKNYTDADRTKFVPDKHAVPNGGGGNAEPAK